MPPLQSIAETRRIYSVIFEQKGASPPRSILITSGWRGEGKTTLACHLATLASQEKGKNVLVIDGNAFAPRVHAQFGLPEPQAMGSINTTASSLDNVIRVPGMKNLSVLPAAGLPRQDHLNGNGLESATSGLMAQAKKRFDQIFIDAPSVYPTNRNMNDPMLLARETDGVILVALTNVTPKAKTKRACCALQSSGAFVLGIVANQWRNPLVQ